MIGPALRPGLLGLCLIAVALLSGCGSSETHCRDLINAEHETCVAELRQEEGKVVENEVPAEDQAAAAEESVGLPLTDVGTLTASDEEGTTFTARYKLGPLLYSQEGTPSETVLDACGANYTTTIQETVFSRGEVTITYQEGSLATTLPLVPTETVSGEAYGGITAFQVDGQWQCGLEAIVLSFEPGETKRLPIWILSQVLNNAEPEVSEAALTTWRFTPPEFTTYPVVSASGPGAARCPSETGEEDMLMLYARPPFEGLNAYGNPVMCRPA